MGLFSLLLYLTPLVATICRHLHCLQSDATSSDVTVKNFFGAKRRQHVKLHEHSCVDFMITSVTPDNSRYDGRPWYGDLFRMLIMPYRYIRRNAGANLAEWR